jgi:hypothetical protein
MSFHVRSSWPKQQYKRARVPGHDYDSRAYRALTDNGRREIRKIDKSNEFRYRGIRLVRAPRREDFIPFLECKNCGQYTVERITVVQAEQKLGTTIPEAYRGMDYRRCACCGQVSAKELT